MRHNKGFIELRDAGILWSGGNTDEESKTGYIDLAQAPRKQNPLTLSRKGVMRNRELTMTYSHMAGATLPLAL